MCVAAVHTKAHHHVHAPHPQPLLPTLFNIRGLSRSALLAHRQGSLRQPNLLPLSDRPQAKPWPLSHSLCLEPTPKPVARQHSFIHLFLRAKSEHVCVCVCVCVCPVPLELRENSIVWGGPLFPTLLPPSPSLTAQDAHAQPRRRVLVQCCFAELFHKPCTIVCGLLHILLFPSLVLGRARQAHTPSPPLPASTLSSWRAQQAHTPSPPLPALTLSSLGEQGRHTPLPLSCPR